MIKSVSPATKTSQRFGLCAVLQILSILIPLGYIHGGQQQPAQDNSQRLTFKSVPDLPNAIGVAGPLVGVHNDVLLVGGGANFASHDDPQLWTLPKKYLDDIWVLKREISDGKTTYQWLPGTGATKLPSPVGYSAVANTDFGVLCLGGENKDGMLRSAFLLGWDPEANQGNGAVFIDDERVPDLPIACTGGGAAVVGDYVYLVAGKHRDDSGQDSASSTIWRLNLNRLRADDNARNRAAATWEPVAAWPNADHRVMFPLVTAQHDGFGDRLYVLGGRQFPQGTDRSDVRNLKFSRTCWVFDPSAFDPDNFTKNGTYSGESPWKKIANSPVPLSAGTAVPLGPAHIVVPAYASGSVLKKQLDSGQPMASFEHPGFPKEAFAYHTITNTWTSYGTIPANQVTTPAVRWGDDIILVSGEVRPRVRSNKVWRIRAVQTGTHFNAVNMTVVVIYLLAMVGIGVVVSRRNKTTEQYFRGGKSVPWWAAGCSIFATMLSSITYMAIPAKAFAQDWVYAIGNVMILCVAPIAVFIALPFFRRLDVTSAYEYLERRFNRTARLIGSGCFSLFHVFRMGVVLALASLALASVTPLTPGQCVVVMGVLSIVYCTIGGIEAVIWTDTVQTVVLMGGALLCLFFALNGSNTGSWEAAMDSDKFHVVNTDFSTMSFTTMALWVVIIGSFGQNVASYTADQAVVQRYMTTADQKLAGRSIWLNGLMAIPAAIIFFGMGTAFWMFYRSHPEKLDPTIATDRIMPLFVSQELPVGLAGLVIAGIFAAAQSTVSTSMNSGATTIVTDFLKPTRMFQSDRKLLWAARFFTLLMGICGTVTGFLFVNPDIKSLFDQFIGILGMFLGVLAGLFALGATTRRANGTGGLIGASVSLLLMICIVGAANDQVLLGLRFRDLFDLVGSKLYQVSGYLYAFIGITFCYVTGYLASLCFPSGTKDLSGLTLWRDEP